VAEAFFDDLLRVPELLDQYRFHMDHRQYANELLLLEYFRSSPCRIRGGGGKGGGTAMTMTMMMKAADDTKTKNSSKKKIMNELNSSTKQAPHYYIIFIPFKNLLGLSRPVTPDQNSRLTSILDRVFSSKTFMFDREHYLYIYTATFHFENHFIAHLHKDFHKLLDHRVVRLGIEGLGGDKRFNGPGLLTKLQRDGGPRLVVVPYFVDRIEHIQAVLDAENYTMGEALTGQASSSSGSRPIKYHMRADADKGHALRAELVRTFRRVDGAVVGFGKLEDEKDDISNSSSASSVSGHRQACMHYLELQHALFCLAPKGLTSSAAR